MKVRIVQTEEKVLPDAVVRRAIEYLDSSTDYREFIPRQHESHPSSRHGVHDRRSDIDDFLLVFVPIFLVAIAVLAVVYG